MKTNRLLSIILSLVLVAGLGTPAFGELVTFDFEIEITSIRTEPDNLLNGITMVGDTITGQYAHDLATADQNPGDPKEGLYQFEEFSFQFDSVSFQGDPPFQIFDNVIVGNDDPEDFFLLDISSVVQQSGPPLPSDNVAMFWELIDFDATVFDDDSLPLTPPSVSDFELNSVELNLSDFQNNQFIDVFGIVTSIELVPSEVVGGSLLSIDSTTLLLGGAQSFSWMIPLVLSGIGIGLFVVSRKSE